MFLKQGLQDEYLVLLGVPFAALVGAKALVRTKARSSSPPPPKRKPRPRIGSPRPSPTTRDRLTSSTRSTCCSARSPCSCSSSCSIPSSSSGLPQLPEALIGLASVGATAYVANKWTAQDAKPHIERVVPSDAKRGATIVIYGTNLLTVSLGGKRAPANEPLEVFFGTRAQQDVDPKRTGRQGERDRQRLHQAAGSLRPGCRVRLGRQVRGGRRGAQRDRRDLRHCAVYDRTLSPRWDSAARGSREGEDARQDRRAQGRAEAGDRRPVAAARRAAESLIAEALTVRAESARLRDGQRAGLPVAACAPFQRSLSGSRSGGQVLRRARPGPGNGHLQTAGATEPCDWQGRCGRPHLDAVKRP